MDTYNSSVLRARLSLRMRILHACSGIITISACVLRIRDYYFSGELASFPLLCPYERSMEKNKSLIYTRRKVRSIDYFAVETRFLPWKCAENVCPNVLSEYTRRRPSLYTTRCNHAQERPTRFSKKTKTGREKKEYGRRLSLHARWTDGTSRTFRFDSERAIF